MSLRLLSSRVLLVVAATFAATAGAAEPISTDRPDFVESSDVVDKGTFQVETSVQLERDHANGVRARNWATPTLLRYGVGNGFELRVESDGLVRSRITEAGTTVTERGTGDASIGTKWHLRDGDEQAGTASLALLLHVDLDSGSAPFRGSGLRPSLRLVAEWELADDWGVGIMPGIARDTDADGKPFMAGIMAVTTSKPIGPNLRGFVEVAGQRIASKRNGGTIATLDTGVTWALGLDMQLDAALQRGLTQDTPDWTFTVGWSARF